MSSPGRRLASASTEDRMDTEFREASNEAHSGERLRALIDRELSESDEAQVRAHLASCPECANEHARLSRVVAALGALGPARAPEGFAGRVLRRVQSQRRTFGRNAPLAHKVPFEGGIIVLLAAAAAAAVLAYGLAANGGLQAHNAPAASEAAP